MHHSSGMKVLSATTASLASVGRLLAEADIAAATGELSAD